MNTNISRKAIAPEFSHRDRWFDVPPLQFSCSAMASNQFCGAAQAHRRESLSMLGTNLLLNCAG